MFDRAARAAGLHGLTPHDLRHTAASLAVSAGGNMKAVQRMLGHASASMTLDVYADLFEDDLDALAGRLDEAAAGALADSVRTGETIRTFPGVSGSPQMQSDLRRCRVPPAGFEPAAHGLGNRYRHPTDLHRYPRNGV